MDVDIAKSKNRLKDSGGMCIYFLDTVEATFAYSSRKGRELLDPDNPWISDNKEIKFVVDPVEEDKSQKGNPVNSYPGPVNRLESNNLNNGALITQKNPGCKDKCQQVEEMVDQNYPMSVEGHDDLLIVFEEGYVFFFDHVICGSLR